ncbi:MAG TPA: glycosyltransferase family 9 protein [Clostridia bacterium]|nr:glycosyltransferase family 9 protein [Clostridia bacterium]
MLKNIRFLARLAWQNPTRVTRNARLWLGGKISPRYSRPAVILANSGGWGDVLMLSTVAHEVRKRNPDALIHIITGRTTVFDRNPDIDFVNRLPRPDVPWRPEFKVQYQHQFPWKRHFLYAMCGCVDIRDSIDLRTYIFPSDDDLAFADQVIRELGQAPVLLARSGKSGEGRKTWPVSHWTELAEKLLRHIPVIDTGPEASPLPIRHPGYRSFLGLTKFHQLAALVARSQAVVTIDAAPNHLAAAFQIPTVCLLGGVFPPEGIQYPNSKVLVTRPACANCWPAGKCHRNLECMSGITVENVVLALNQLSPGLLHSTHTCEPVAS